MRKREIRVEHIVSIPDEMIGRVIGKNGKTKSELEKALEVKIFIKDGVATIRGKDSLKVLKAEEVVKALAFGFPHDDAKRLLEENNEFMSFDIEKAVPPAHLKRFIGRIIGEKGKSKIRLQELTGVTLYVTKEKVAGIGSPMHLQVLKEALERLIEGATHANVYTHIEARMADLENL